MSKVKVRAKSRTLHAALRDAGVKKKKAAKVANTFDASYTPAERKQQRKKAGRKGGKATARKQSERKQQRKKAGRKGGKATARKQSANAKKSPSGRKKKSG